MVPPNVNNFTEASVVEDENLGNIFHKGRPKFSTLEQYSTYCDDISMPLQGRAYVTPTTEMKQVEICNLRCSDV